LKFGIYDCRRIFAICTVESEIRLLTLAAMLGHSNPGAHLSEAKKILCRRDKAASQTESKANILR